MIFVTLGTQDKQFPRLLDEVQKEIDRGNIKDKVVVQAGQTKYESDDMEIYDLLPQDEFEEYINKCDVLITHGGVGNIFTGLNHNKKIIVAPRLFKYGEHTNDHQVQIVDKFSEEGYILKFNDGDDLAELIKKAKKFKPNKWVSNTENFVSKIRDYIENN